jgi:hypothetical protein
VPTGDFADNELTNVDAVDAGTGFGLGANVGYEWENLGIYAGTEFNFNSAGDGVNFLELNFSRLDLYLGPRLILPLSNDIKFFAGTYIGASIFIPYYFEYSDINGTSNLVLESDEIGFKFNAHAGFSIYGFEVSLSIEPKENRAVFLQ